MQALDLLPQQTGAVSYDVVASVGNSGAARFTLAQMGLVARDPAPPLQVAILNPLPACTAAQLRVKIPDPVVTGRLQALRAYEAINISPSACALGGLPNIRFLDEHGAVEPLLPKPCPNCDNDLFAPRPNGRIDLDHGDSAHFLVAATSIDTQEDPWMHCQQANALEFKVSQGDAPITLPFPAGACAAIDISTWRSGDFDHDPLNKQWAKKQEIVFKEPTAPFPPDCDKPGLRSMGHPSMLPAEGRSIVYGWSLASHRFVLGQEMPLHLWVDNPTDKPVSVMTCEDLDFFKTREFDLFDAYGHLVMRKWEAKMRERCSTDPTAVALGTVWSCTRNFPITIPAKTCVNGDGYDFTIQLAQVYELTPGEYTVHAREGHDDVTKDICNQHQEKPFIKTPGVDLTFEVVQP